MTLANKRLKKLYRRSMTLLPRWRWLYAPMRHYVNFIDGAVGEYMEYNGEVRFLQAALTGIDNPVVFDVGANVGDWSRHVAENFPSAQLHAFEPGAVAFAKLMKQPLPASACRNQTAVGDEDGEVTFYTSAASSRSSVHSSESTQGESHTVPMTTLGSYCHHHGIGRVDYLKIDTEGHDLHVLRGAAELIAGSHVSIAQFEYNDVWVESRTFLKDVFDLLDGLPYRLFTIIPNGIVERRYTYSLERFQLVNYVALHESQIARLKHLIRPF